MDVELLKEEKITNRVDMQLIKIKQSNNKIIYILNLINENYVMTQVFGDGDSAFKGFDEWYRALSKEV